MKTSSAQKAGNKELFETMPIGRALATMAVPTVFSQLIVLVYSLADTFYLGRTNNPYMVAGASLILPIFNITIPLASMAGMGGGTLISRLLGQNKEEEARKVSGFSICLAFVIAATFALATGLFEQPLMRALGAGPETIDYAAAYTTCVIVFGAVPTILSNTISALLRSVGASKKAGFGITLGGVLNIILDPLFMFVIMPDGKEILGAGIATMLSNYIACAYFVITMYRMRKTTVLTLKPAGMPEHSSIRSLFNVGIPAAVVTLLFDLDYIVLDKLMAGYSDIALAAVGIVLKAERFPLNTGIGICQGMVPLIAYNYSARNIKRMDGFIRTARRTGIAVGIASVTCYLIFAPQIMRFFINDAQTVALGTDFLRFRCLATPLMFLCFFIVHLFQSFGKGHVSLILGIARWLAFNIPMLFLLNYLMGMYGLVLSQLMGDILTVTFSFIIYGSYRKKMKQE